MTVLVKDIKAQCREDTAGLFYVYFYEFITDRYIIGPHNSTGMLILITCKSRIGELTAIRQSEACLLWDYVSISDTMSNGDDTVILQGFPKSGWDVPLTEPESFNNVNDLVERAKRGMLLELL